MKWTRIIPDFISKQWSQWFQKIEGALVAFKPHYIAKNNNLFSPLIALIAVIWSIFLVGIAIGSFSTLFASLLVLYFILTKIFGISLETGDVFVV